MHLDEIHLTQSTLLNYNAIWDTLQSQGVHTNSQNQSCKQKLVKNMIKDQYEEKITKTMDMIEAITAKMLVEQDP